MKNTLRITRTALLTASSLAVIGSVLLAQGGNQPASALFRDDTADNIQSDDGTAYVDGSECVSCWVDKRRGFFFLRTEGYDCSPGRKIVLDFRGWVGSRPSPCEVEDALGQGTLNICGANSLPDVRIIADTLFKDSALSAGTVVKLPFNLKHNFSSGAAFDLEFEQAVDVDEVVGDTNSRILRAVSTAPNCTGAVAELYRRSPRGRRESLGRFCMPFQLTVTKQQ